jgi:hypothetical protein
MMMMMMMMMVTMMMMMMMMMMTFLRTIIGWKSQSVLCDVKTQHSDVKKMNFLLHVVIASYSSYLNHKVLF